MRTETRTVRIGEKVGEIDWSYDFRSHFDCMGAPGARRDEACREAVARLRAIVEHPSEVTVTVSDGFPRCRVLDTGMYDGWPWWRPVPHVLIGGTFGHEWQTFDRIGQVYINGERFVPVRG